MKLRACRLADLHILDERAFAAVDHYAALKARLDADGYRFRVLDGDGRGRWDRALFLNLTYWGAGDGDVLEDRRIAADVVAHAGWHHVARAHFDEQRLGGSADALLFAEAVASAYDLFIVGRLLGAGRPSRVLDTQVAAMAEACQEAGLDARGFSSLLEHVGADPEGAFEALRALLFSTSTALVRAQSTEAAARILGRADASRFAPLLHHYELSSWTLYVRAYAPTRLGPVPAIRALDRRLRRDGSGSLARLFDTLCATPQAPRRR